MRIFGFWRKSGIISTADQGIADWQAEFTRFKTALATAERVVFSPGNEIYFLGTTWHIAGLYESLCDVSKEGVKCIFYVHDMIPMNHTEYIVPHYEAIFSYSLYGITKVADAIICNSEATRRDFLELTGYDRPVESGESGNSAPSLIV